jgi:hypothetical protein
MASFSWRSGTMRQLNDPNATESAQWTVLAGGGVRWSDRSVAGVDGQHRQLVTSRRAGAGARPRHPHHMQSVGATAGRPPTAIWQEGEGSPIATQPSHSIHSPAAFVRSFVATVYPLLHCRWYWLLGVIKLRASTVMLISVVSLSTCTASLHVFERRTSHATSTVQPTRIRSYCSLEPISYATVFFLLQ